MEGPVRVLVLGTGEMGSGIARLLLAKPGLLLAGVFARRAARSGLDLGRVIGMERDLGIPIWNDLSALITQVRPRIAIQATCSRLDDALPELDVLLEHGVDIISIAEEMAWPAASSPGTAARLRGAAMDRGVRVLGTGINPGFVLDLLVIALSGVCADVRAISALRVNDLSPYGPSVLSAQGVGLSPEVFRQGLKTGAVAGHIGFRESIHMISAALGWPIDRIEEVREPIVSSVRRVARFATVEPGQVAGCDHSATAFRENSPVITLRHPQQIHPHLAGIETRDEIRIEGTPAIRLSGRPEIPGGQATAALAVNMIPRVLSAPPGLYSMAELPVPAALLGDARSMIHDWRRST